MESIGLFGAASDRLEASYYDLAGAFGRLVGERGLTLVYGGADSGLMESAARGVKDAGGHVVGIVPSVLEARRRVSRYVDEVVPCHDLSDRKAIMVERSDVLVALPGGIGTLDEVFTVMAANSIGYHRKKVVLFALDGFWDGLVEVLQEMDRRGFVNVPLSWHVRGMSFRLSWRNFPEAHGTEGKDRIGFLSKCQIQLSENGPYHSG